MIHSKLKKGKISQLLVEFSKEDQKLPRMIKNFNQVCKQENIRVNRFAGLKQNIIRFYTIDQNNQNIFNQSSKQQDLNFNMDKILKSSISTISLKFIVIYIHEQDYQLPDFQQAKGESKDVRIILLRQTLQNSFFSLDYEVQNTLSQQQSLMYLCDLSAMIINCQHEGQIQVYDQKKDNFLKKGKQNDNSQLQIIWKNIIYQTPGLGKEKCKAIAQAYPTYQSLLKDYQKEKQLKNLKIGRGTKQMKLGSAIADRLYKIFNSTNPDQLLY